MKYFNVLCILLCLGNHLLAQSIAKEKAVEDLIFLNEVVINGHPVNYNPANKKVTVDGVLQKLKDTEKDSLTILEFRSLLNEAIFDIGCIHTRITKLVMPESKSIKLFFSTLVFIKNDKLVDSLGHEIRSINGVSTRQLMHDFRQLYASDGGTSALSTAVFNKSSSALLSRYFNYPTEYTIDSENGMTSIVAVSGIPEMPKKLNTSQENELVTNAKNRLYRQGAIPILKLTNFYKNDISFLDRAFTYIEKSNSSYLILDLRGNLGGNRNSAVHLSKWLLTNPFTYSILQPKLSLRRYLNGKGKFYLFLSTLKYNVGDLFKSKKTALGREFVYTFKPKKNSFKGQIYVLTDGYTASASTMVTSWLKQHTNALFIGQQSGGGYNGNNGGSFPSITLPNTKCQIVFPAYRLVLDGKSAQDYGIVPDLVIEPAIREDTVLTKTIQLIQSRKGSESR